MSIASARGVLGSPLLGALLLAGAAIGSACGPRVQLAQTLESPDAVAHAVVLGLTARDAGALRAIALTEDEFRRLVWPKLPTSRPERNIPWDYVWKDLAGKSRMQLQARLNEWHDRGFTVVGVSYAGETTDYETFRVHRATEVTLRDSDGHETKGRLFGSLIEQHGRYKVFSYVTD